MKIPRWTLNVGNTNLGRAKKRREQTIDENQATCALPADYSEILYCQVQRKSNELNFMTLNRRALEEVSHYYYYYYNRALCKATSIRNPVKKPSNPCSQQDEKENGLIFLDHASHSGSTDSRGSYNVHCQSSTGIEVWVFNSKLKLNTTSAHHIFDSQWTWTWTRNWSNFAYICPDPLLSTIMQLQFRYIIVICALGCAWDAWGDERLKVMGVNSAAPTGWQSAPDWNCISQNGTTIKKQNPDSCMIKKHEYWLMSWHDTSLWNACLAMIFMQTAPPSERPWLSRFWNCRHHNLEICSWWWVINDEYCRTHSTQSSITVHLSCSQILRDAEFNLIQRAVQQSASNLRLSTSSSISFETVSTILVESLFTAWKYEPGDCISKTCYNGKLLTASLPPWFLRSVVYSAVTGLLSVKTVPDKDTVSAMISELLSAMLGSDEICLTVVRPLSFRSDFGSLLSFCSSGYAIFDHWI